MINFYGTSANSLYHQVISYFAQGDAFEGPAPRGMRTREVPASVCLAESRRCKVTIPERRLNHRFMEAEFWWIATGRSDVASISRYCGEIAKFSDDGVSFFGAYGARWLPQVRHAIAALRRDPDTRQAIVNLWRNYPEPIINYPDDIPQVTRDVPCTLSFQYLLRDGELRCIATMRSWDAWLGMPYDLFNFARLQAMVAGELEAPAGWLTVNAGSLHMYERDRERALEVARAGAADSPLLPEMPGLVPAEYAAHGVTLDDVVEALSPWVRP